MPVQVMITQVEAEAAKFAGVGEINGRSLSYDPRETLALCQKLEESGHDGAARLVTRLADIYGKNFLRPAAVRPPRVAQAPASMPRGRVYATATGAPPVVRKRRRKRATEG